MTSLNKEQRAASGPGGGVSLVIAGAGTGKTSTMLKKISNVLTQSDIPPSSILILTFSRHGAEEIKRRLTSLTGLNISDIFAGTFHSFCLRVLKDYRNEYLKKSGYREFPEIMEERDNGIIREIIMKDPGRFKGLPCGAVLRLTDENVKLKPLFMEKLKNCGLMGEIEKVKEEYSLHKKENGLIDFGDLMDHCIDLIDSNRDVRRALIKKYRYIFVDEFQDTSEKNFRLLSLILPDINRNLFMVGDDYQSIYGFRNAKIEYIINIKDYFRDAEIYKLTKNYRSRREIVQASNKFIHLNRFRTSKKIVSMSGRGGTVKMHRVSDRQEEVNKIQILLSGSGGTGVVLARNNYQVSYIKDKIKYEFPEIDVMTMHASKGLEFDRVIIAGVSDRIIPDRTTNIEEERRLFYVALTRAREVLHIIYLNDSRDKLPRFIKELGKKE